MRGVENSIIQDALALINWAINIQEEIVERISRVNCINDIISLDKPAFETIFIELFVYKERHFMTTQDATAYYNEQVDNGGSYRGRTINVDQFRKGVSNLLTRLNTKRGEIYAHRKNGRRGYVNLAPRGNDNLETMDFVFKLDQNLVNLLSLNPFHYNGVILYDHKRGFVLYKKKM